MLSVIIMFIVYWIISGMILTEEMKLVDKIGNFSDYPILLIIAYFFVGGPYLWIKFCIILYNLYKGIIEFQEEIKKGGLWK